MKKRDKVARPSRIGSSEVAIESSGEEPVAEHPLLRQGEYRAGLENHPLYGQGVSCRTT